MSALAGAATAMIGLAVLIAGLLPPHVMTTGQLDLGAWMLPALCGAVILLLLLRRIMGRLPGGTVVLAMLASVGPILLFCVAGAGMAPTHAFTLASPVMPIETQRPVVAILSGPELHAPDPDGAMRGGFVEHPLWRGLSRLFALRPIDSLEGGALRGVATLLVIQPRAMAPTELVALDLWVREGGRVLLLADPDLRWADQRPLGHALRPPPSSLLGPLLTHWGLDVQPVEAGGRDPVERRFMADGRMIQTAAASRFVRRGPQCALSAEGLVARCALGRGTAILVADADFANASLWTTAPDAPEKTDAWTSDAVVLLADWLSPGAGEGGGRRLWLVRADGLSEALRPALMLLGLLSLAMAFAARPSPKNPPREVAVPG